MCNREPQQVADLARRYDHGDPGSEAYSDRKRDVFDVRPGTQQPDGNENQPRDDGCKGETVIAMPFNHAGDEADEGAGRSSNLKATPADKGNNETTHNSGVEAALRRCSRGDGDSHRKRQRDNGNCEAGDCIGPQVWPAVTFTENRDQLRRE
jgi:hypothetical protein